ncbi:hypothetical protein SGFS_044420 [Streptomyces graminofaciens]|uniref:Uncharacterized protein n=1 Tax=Streptomyces graminofaciens TaxID=68212 RepID=A0ABN5VL43_9ACTN|nr:hypothetical protein SGFS_044420 [Streptomyces graminofaciens]
MCGTRLPGALAVCPEVLVVGSTEAPRVCTPVARRPRTPTLTAVPPGSAGPVFPPLGRSEGP